MLTLVSACMLWSFSAFGQTVTQSSNTWDGSIEQKVMGLVTVWSEAKVNFPFFDQRQGLDWDEKVREYLPRAISAPDIDSYYDVLCEFAALLKDGHTAVNRPVSPLDSSNDWPPLEVQVVDDKYIVARLERTAELTKNNVYAGLEIIEVDGVPVVEYFHTHVTRFESRGTQHADEALNIYKLLLGPKNTEVRIRVKDWHGKERSVVLTRNSATKSGGRFLPRLLEWYLTESPIAVKKMQHGILYVTIANFGNDQVVAEFLRIFDQIDWNDTKGVILDIRFNPGGDDQFAWPIISCFINSPIPSLIWKSPKYVPARASWGQAPEWEQGPLVGDIQPRDGKRFSGPLVILTGHATYSTAEDFIIPFDYSGRAVLVGETTAGSTGNPLRVSLPGGGNFRVVTLRTLYPDGREWVGRGIQPCIEAHPLQIDIYEGRDPILAKGIEVIRNWDVYNKAKRP